MVIPMASDRQNARTEQLTTTEYGVRIKEHPPDPAFGDVPIEYWSPEPTSKEEALELAAEKEKSGPRNVDVEVLSDVADVKTRTVTVPEKWPEGKKRKHANLEEQ